MTEEPTMQTPPKPEHPIEHVEVNFPGVEWVNAVYLDGEEQKDAVAASETEGYVVRYERTEDGGLRLNAFGLDPEWVYEKVEGEVRIELRDEPRADP